MADIETIADLTLDPKNARRRGPRATGMLEASLQEVGAARSIVIDEAGRILAGNGTVEAAGQVGIERVKVVDADGETLIAVRRRGLTEAQKRRLAVLDNRTGELAEWDTQVLAELAADGLELDGLWNENEFALLLGQIQDPDDPREHWEGMPDFQQGDETPQSSIIVQFANEDDRMQFMGLLGEKPDRVKSIWYPHRGYLKQST